MTIPAYCDIKLEKDFLNTFTLYLDYDITNLTYNMIFKDIFGQDMTYTITGTKDLTGFTIADFPTKTFMSVSFTIDDTQFTGGEKYGLGQKSPADSKPKKFFEGKILW